MVHTMLLHMAICCTIICKKRDTHSIALSLAFFVVLVDLYTNADVKPTISVFSVSSIVRSLQVGY